MDDKTEELRDIFLDVADEETVTEPQEELRGSLADGEATDERIRSVIEQMRDRYEFRTSLSTDELVTVVRGYFAGKNDTAIARDLGDASLAKTVRRARIDLHLVTDRDLDAPFDLDDLRQQLDSDRPVTDIAEDLDVSESTVRRYRHVVEVQDERRLVGDRFHEEFAMIAEDRDLGERLTADVKESGLEEATEGMETNVSF